jgi:cytidylate kinase
VLVDTGALYRCVALAAQRAGVSWDDASGVARVASELAHTRGIRFERNAAGQQVLLLDEDVSLAIRTQEISDGASKVSAVADVRDALLAIQRTAGEPGGAVLEGRDIGTVVFPDAEAKFFLTASVDVRASRRYRELLDRGHDTEFELVRQEVEARDRRDTQRPVAPLRQADDAVLLDTSALDIDHVVTQIVEHVRNIESSMADA